MRRNVLFILVLVVCIGAFSLYLLIDRQNADRGRPTITVSGEALELSVQDPKEAYLQGVTAFDDKDGDVTASLVVADVRLLDTDGTIEVTYAAFDKAGNVGKAQRTMRYTDYVGPRFSLSAPLLYTFGAQFDVLNQVEVTDPLDGDIRHKVKTMLLDSEALTAEGIHQVRFRVTNSLGDMEELILPVEVQYSGRHSAQLHLTSYLVYLKVGEAFSPNDYLSQVVRQGNITKLDAIVPGDMHLSLESDVDTAAPGVYTVGYTLTGPQSGGWSAYSKLIVVVEE